MKMLVFGCGNMASALVLGYTQKSNDLNFICYTPSKTKAIELAQKSNGQVLDSLDEIPEAEFYLIGCKPQQFYELAQNLKGKLSPKATVISILAGVSIIDLQQKLEVEQVVRVMPNTPTKLGYGSNLCYFHQVNDERKTKVLSFLSGHFKATEFSQESLIDDITGVVASGPAYIFEWARIMEEHLIQNQINPSQARKLIQELFLGSAQLLFQSENSFEELRNQVTSKGGVTFEALESMKTSNLESIFHHAFEKAKKRTYELKAGK